MKREVRENNVKGKKKKLIKQTNGVTLISLVITIIILLILAGVTLSLTLGENGIITQANKAKEAQEIAAIKEDFQLAILDKELEKGGTGLTKEELEEIASNYGELQEDGNTIKTEEGYEIKIDEIYQLGGGTSTPGTETDNETILALEEEIKELEQALTDSNNIITNLNNEIAELKTAYEVTLSNGETVPVPYGFYYVGGTIQTGVVISDNEADRNKYANVANGDVPAGVAYNADGTVNEANSELKGNQFVWIPCNINEYVKTNWGSSYKNATWETQTNTAELVQIIKYGGFYIARYEAGTSDISLSTGIDFAAQNTASDWQNTNFSIRDGLGNSATGKITSKAGEIPYYHADYFTALKLSNGMYQTDYVQSGLVTGTMWDAAMRFIAGNDNSVVTASTWGNYNNTSSYVTYTAGQGRYATVNSSTGAMTSAFKVSDGAYHYGIKTTAVSENVKKKNLYDIAGNLWEWTQEASYPDNTNESYVLRGGSFRNSYSDYPACFRGSNTATDTSTNHGIRPALYIK